MLRDQTLVPPETVLEAIRSREWALVLAMVAARILAPYTRLPTTSWSHTTTLAEDFGVADAEEAELLAGMDWLRERQGATEQELAARHLPRRPPSSSPPSPQSSSNGRWSSSARSPCSQGRARRFPLSRRNDVQILAAAAGASV